MKALLFSSFGEADVLDYAEISTPRIKKNEILVKNKAIGLNYADIYRRRGNYHLEGNPPYIAGYEGAGIVVESKSRQYKVEDRIAYTDVPFANADYIVVPEDYAIPIPNNMDFELAASVLLQGLTALYLSQDSYEVKKGDTVLIHAAAGGVGQLLTQICKSKGAYVIGLTRNRKKLQTILNSNADEAIILNDIWKEKVMSLTNNIGVDVVYDSIGTTLLDSFDVTKICGHVIFYGMSGGNTQAINPRMLLDTSKTLTGGDLWNYLTSAKERKLRAEQLFSLIDKRIIKIAPPVKFKLSEGKKAHIFLENGESSSKILLIPDDQTA